MCRHGEAEWSLVLPGTKGSPEAAWRAVRVVGFAGLVGLVGWFGLVGLVWLVGLVGLVEVQSRSHGPRREAFDECA